MPNVLDINSIGVPGAFVFESTFGAIPQDTASFSRCYMLGYAAKVGAPVATPTPISSPTDFGNVFGASNSANSVQLFFDQRPGSSLTFVNVEPRKSQAVTIPTATVGTVYTITIDSYPISYTSVTGDTASSILAKLADRINTEVPFNATLINGVLRLKTSVSATATANITLGTSTAAAAYPTVGDVLDTANRVFTDGMDQGFIIAPEFYQTFTQSADVAALANGLDAVASDPRVLCVHLADCLQSTATSQSGGGAINLARAEVAAIASPRGHTAFYFPYVKNLNGTLVPPSGAVAGVALRRYRQESFRQPPAGANVPILGITGFSFTVGDNEQQLLNPVGVNCLRKKGSIFVVWGARTVSTSAFYKFIAARVILNIYERTIKNALDTLVFESIDGLGALFDRCKTTCVTISERFRLAGAFYGASPDDAYRVVCDSTNNPGIDLDNGILRVDCYVKPSPTAEVIRIGVYRSSLGTTLTADTPYKLDLNGQDVQTGSQAQAASNGQPLR